MMSVMCSIASDQRAASSEEHTNMNWSSSTSSATSIYDLSKLYQVTQHRNHCQYWYDDEDDKMTRRLHLYLKDPAGDDGKTFCTSTRASKFIYH